MPSQKHLTFNSLAPDVELLTTEGKPVLLSQLWQSAPVVLAFTRHFGCPQCKEMMDELYSSRPELEKRGLRLVIITQGTPEQAQAFCASRAPGSTCLSDASRAAYAAYGLEHGSLWQTMLSPNIWKSNQRLEQEKGYKPELPPAGQDAFVMSGTFIIGTDGRVRLPYYYEDIADHPPADLLLHGLMGASWGKPLEGAITPDE
jgi:peroxiredoxin